MSFLRVLIILVNFVARSQRAWRLRRANFNKGNMKDNTRSGHRDPEHDYRSRCIYLITITELPGAPRFAEVVDSAVPYSRILYAGEVLCAAIAETFSFPDIDILKRVLMPDHVHLVVFVKEQLEHPIGYYIRKLKSLTTGKLRHELNQPDLRVFEPDFHDRILRGRKQLPAMINYVADNPRRLALRRRMPELFVVRRSIMVCGHEFDACGNLFLLDDFDCQAVRVHRRWTPEEMHDARAIWRRCAINGGTLVSPFIHPVEKEVFKESLELHGRIILLTTEPMGERYKPGGRYFDLCAQGRLLVLHPAGFPDRELTRADALAMNEFAEKIALRNEPA